MHTLSYQLTRSLKLVGFGLMALCCEYAFAETPLNLLLSINRSIPVAGVYAGVFIGDIDGDGKRELLVTDYKDKEIEIYQVTGKTPKLTGQIKFPEIPVAIALGDTDNDGVKELVVGTGNGDRGGYVYVGTYQAGAFVQEWKSPLIKAIRFEDEIAIGNLNNSINKKEIIVGVSWHGRYLASFQYNGAGYQQIFKDAIGSDVNSVVSADLNGDGKRDLLVGTACWSDYSLRVYERGYQLKKRLKTDAVTEVAAFDLDSDGVKDVIAATGTSCGGASAPRPMLRVFGYSNGELTEKARATNLTTLNDVRVTLAARRMNETPVVAIGTQTGASNHVIKLFDKNLCQLWQYPLPAKEMVYDLAIGDINNDGKNELVAATNKRILAFKARRGVPLSCTPIN